MKITFPSFKMFNGNILLMEWKAEIDPKQMYSIEQFATLLKDQNSYTCTDIVPAYHSLTIYFKDEIIHPNELFDSLKSAYFNMDHSTRFTSKIWRIPLVYGGHRGPDFESVCMTLNLDKEELISRHTAPIYDVHFIGFLPGFPYLGGLDPSLHIARKSVPAISTNAGSVGIGGSQTGIYPVNAPAGWHVIGQTPFPLFDIKRSPPFVIKSGDQIKFYSIQESEIEGYRQNLQNEIVGIYGT